MLLALAASLASWATALDGLLDGLVARSWQAFDGVCLVGDAASRAGGAKEASSARSAFERATGELPPDKEDEPAREGEPTRNGMVARDDVYLGLLEAVSTGDGALGFVVGSPSIIFGAFARGVSKKTTGSSCAAAGEGASGSAGTAPKLARAGGGDAGVAAQERPFVGELDRDGCLRPADVDPIAGADASLVRVILPQLLPSAGGWLRASTAALPSHIA